MDKLNSNIGLAHNYCSQQILIIIIIVSTIMDTCNMYYQMNVVS